MKRTHCRHCGHPKVTRPRGLCWTCYHQPGIRAEYASESKYARRGVRDQSGAKKTPEPTDALPGTAEKVAVLRQRAARGEQLWHPLDRTNGPLA